MIESFKTNGYLHVPSVVPNGLLTLIDDFAANLERTSMEKHMRGDHNKGVCVVDSGSGDKVMRVDDLFGYNFDLLNELIATPKLLELIKSICGPKAVILQADLLFKQQYPHPVIKWHQDAPTEHESHFLNIGIYLDHAGKDDGCVRYVPGTQHELQDIASVEKEYGWNPPGVVQVPTEPGDIIIQEMMVLHSSEPKRSEGVRRTVYIEVRPYDALIEEGIYNRDWIETRKLWMGEILRHDQEDIFTEEEKKFFEANSEMTKEELVLQMQSVHSAPIPAVYSIFSNEGPDYPIPEDLK